jgi:hypothetical protein
MGLSTQTMGPPGKRDNILGTSVRDGRESLSEADARSCGFALL